MPEEPDTPVEATPVLALEAGAFDVPQPRRLAAPPSPTQTAATKGRYPLIDTPEDNATFEGSCVNGSPVSKAALRKKHARLTSMHVDTRLKDGRRLFISHARPSDAEEMVGYVIRVSGESDFLSFGAGELGLSVEDEVKFIAELEDGTSGFMLKGIVDTQIVSMGYVARQKRARVRHLGQFGITVAKSHWGLGIGRAMCLAMLDVARDVGVTKVNLRARDDNAKAIGLYESVGFEHEGVTHRALKIGERYYSEVLMGISLD